MIAVSADTMTRYTTNSRRKQLLLLLCTGTRITARHRGRQRDFFRAESSDSLRFFYPIVKFYLLQSKPRDHLSDTFVASLRSRLDILRPPREIEAARFRRENARKINKGDRVPRVSTMIMRSVLHSYLYIHEPALVEQPYRRLSLSSRVAAKWNGAGKRRDARSENFIAV